MRFLKLDPNNNQYYLVFPVYRIFSIHSFAVEKDGDDSSKFKYKLNVAKILLKLLKLQEVVILEINVIRITVVQ